MQDGAVPDWMRIERRHPEPSQRENESGGDEDPTGHLVPAPSSAPERGQELEGADDAERDSGHDVQDDRNRRTGEPRSLGDELRPAGQLSEPE
jgi:hypothetical protein